MSATLIEFEQRPALGMALIKALVLPRKGFESAQGLPDIRARWPAATVDQQVLSRYLATLDLPPCDTLPVLFPHVMAGAMHMQMLAHAAFPIRLLGAVHLKNRIVQNRPLGRTHRFDFGAALGPHRLVAKGLEFDLSTTVSQAGEIVWQEVSTYFVAGRLGGASHPGGPSLELTNLEGAPRAAQWHIPRDRGRRYAALSGDYNPIHLSPWLAKLFGLKRDIAHGFGVLAQAVHHAAAARVGANTATQPASRIELDVVFKGPVYLDSSVSLHGNFSLEPTRFDLYCGDNPKPSLCAALRLSPA